MSGKGSGRRPGEGYASGWDAIFGKKEPRKDDNAAQEQQDKNEQERKDEDE